MFHDGPAGATLGGAFRAQMRDSPRERARGKLGVKDGTVFVVAFSLFEFPLHDTILLRLGPETIRNAARAPTYSDAESRLPVRSIAHGATKCVLNKWLGAEV